MSEIASVVERTRKAFASISQLEAAIARDPSNRALQLNLSAMRKVAEQSQEQLEKFSELNHIEVCNYRLLPEASQGYSLPYVSSSLLEYQNLFSQIYDAKKQGPKIRAILGDESFHESLLDFAYSYSGSLGVVLLAHSERDFFEGKLDSTIDTLFQVLEINSRNTVREIANTLGRAVVKRLHDWSSANLKGGFAADVRWNKSDGRRLGEVIERRKMENIVGYIDATSDEKNEELWAIGFLVGGNLKSRTFLFVTTDGREFRGRLAKNFSPTTDMILGKRYAAKIFRTEKIVYATERTEEEVELMQLGDPTTPAPDFAGD
jgi:hypothetical protein